MLQPDTPSNIPLASTVRRPWCLYLAIALVLLGALSNTLYLWHHCPLGFSEDESHYWEWARHLDYGYYSKPPGIAWLLWLAQRLGTLLHLTGDGSGTALMPVLRMPAVLFGLLSGLLSLFLARRIFRDDRIALTVILLSAAVPMFAVGSLLITIDSPMYLCWAASTFCLWRVIEHRERPIGRAAWLYLAALAAAAGMLFKPVLIALPICAFIAACADPLARRALKTWHSLIAFLIVLSSLIPTLLWNAHHHWVTFMHIATQGGFVGAGEKKSWLLATLQRFGDYLGGQAGGMGGIMFILLVIAARLAWKHATTPAQPSPQLLSNPLATSRLKTPTQQSPQLPSNPLATSRPTTPPPSPRTQWSFLLSFTLPLWAFYFLMNFWKGTEVNWPAASYFTGMILLAGIVTQGWHSPLPKTRRAWRTWATIATLWGFALTMVAMNTDRLYPLLAPKIPPARWDNPMIRLRGLDARAAIIDHLRDQLRAQTGQDPMIITDRYDTSSSLSFYMQGHPFAFCISANVGGRESQYDLWPGVNQKSPAGALLNAGRPALLVGNFSPEIIATVLRPAFTRLEGPTRFPITFDGIPIKTMNVYRAYNFQGMPTHPAGKY